MKTPPPHQRQQCRALELLALRLVELADNLDNLLLFNLDDDNLLFNLD